MLIGQRGLRLRVLGVGLHRMPQFQNRFVAQPQFGRQLLGGLAFAEPSQHQDDLHWREMRLLKNGPAVKIVGGVTMQATVHDQLAFPGLPEDTRLFRWLMAFRTGETTRVEVLDYPRNTTVMVKKIYNWEFHSLSLPLQHTFYR